MPGTSTRRQLALIAVVLALAVSGVGVWLSTSPAASASGSLAAEAWPGEATVTTASAPGQFGTDLSGLYYERGATVDQGTLWAARNDVATLFKLRRSGTTWVPVTESGWAAGKTLANVSGTVGPDAEAVTLTSAGASGGLFVAAERSNANKKQSSLTVLRYDVTGTSGTRLNATREWNITGDLPAVDPNKGLESLAWVPDTDLVASGFLDERAGRAYEPGDYPQHGAGLFLVGMEAWGTVYAYALNQASGDYTRVATIPIPEVARSAGFATMMELQWDADRHQLWAACDDGCSGRMATYEIAPSGPDAGHFVVTHVYARPSGMINANNEGFTFAPDAECVAGLKSVWWADDDQNAGYSVRAGTLTCPTPESEEPEPTVTPTAEPTLGPTPSVPPEQPGPTAQPTTPQPTSKPTKWVHLKAAVSVRALKARKLRVTVKVRGKAAPQYSGNVRVKVRGIDRTFTARVRNGAGIVNLGAKLNKGQRVRLAVTAPARVIKRQNVRFAIAKTVQMRILRLR